MDPIVVIFTATVGLLIGSFLNVVIARLPLEDPEMRSIGGRSRCPNCLAPIAGYDNIPLFSWLILRGKCRNCKVAISARYPMVELLTCGLFLAVALDADRWITLVEGCVLMAILVPVVFIDLDHRIIPNVLNYSGAVVGLALSIAAHPHDWWQYVVAALGASGFLLTAALVRPGGMGLGDVKFAALMGAFLGRGVIPSMFGGFVLAIVPSIWLFARHGRKARTMAIPFGPFLAAGTAIGWFWGTAALDAYLHGMH